MKDDSVKMSTSKSSVLYSKRDLKKNQKFMVLE
jgi:hypothetical protein